MHLGKKKKGVGGGGGGCREGVVSETEKMVRGKLNAKKSIRGR